MMLQSLMLAAAGQQGGALAILQSAISWYDARDLTSTTQQTLPNRVGAGVATFGSTPEADTNDPVRLPWDGTDYVYLPGTSGNHLSVARGAGWAATTHITATRLDNTTATFVSTADPIVVGGTSLTAGSYRRFDLRDTDGAGTLRATIDLATETLGQSSWTATTGQTVTVNRATSGLTTAVATRPIALFDGVDDFIQLPASDTPTFTATTGEHTVLLLYRVSAVPASGARLWSAETGANVGLYVRAVTANVAAAVNVTTTPSLAGTVGAITAVAAVADDGTLATWVPNTMSSTQNITGFTFTHTTPRINGRAYTSISFLPMEFFACVQWNRALTAQELNDVSAYLLGAYT
jgi:hypothetical protein